MPVERSGRMGENMSGNTIIPITEGVSMMRFEYRDFMDKALELWEKNKKEVEKIAKIQDPVYSFAYWLFRYSGLIQPIEQVSGK